MKSALQPLLDFGALRKSMQEMNKQDEEKYRKTHKPRFKNEQELGEYLMTPQKRRKTNINFDFIV